MEDGKAVRLYQLADFDKGETSTASTEVKVKNRECPFCGRAQLRLEYATKRIPEIRDSELYETIVGFIKCSMCNCKGPTAAMIIPRGTFRFREELEIRAYNLWNNRARAEQEKV